MGLLEGNYTLEGMKGYADLRAGIEAAPQRRRGKKRLFAVWGRKLPYHALFGAIGEKIRCAAE
jgi:hypothetical protein